MFVVVDNVVKKEPKQEKEAIHSGHFMVSHFEAEAQDDEDEVAVPIPDVPCKETFEKPFRPLLCNGKLDYQVKFERQSQQIAIETNLSKLFQCMSLAYRQKLTSPKWNRFRGIRLRWKDKIRLNNLIWRCWHMQFVKKENTIICQFASPLDVDTHNKPEAVVLEGKYWKRKLAAVTAEYKKWRMFYRNQTMGHSKDSNDIFNEMELMKWDFQSPENVDNMLVDEDYMGLMSDTLFSTIANQPFAFPDSREIAKAGLADFIQPSLGPLQPNLPNNDFMDTMEHFDMLSGKLPTVPEEHGNDGMYGKQMGWCYGDLDLMNSGANLQITSVPNTANIMEQYQSLQAVGVEPVQAPGQVQQPQQMNYENEIMMQQAPVDTFMRQNTTATYQSSVISKSTKPPVKDLSPTHKQSHVPPSLYSKSMDNVYSYTISEINSNILPVDDRLQLREHDFKILSASDPNSSPSSSSSSQPFRITPQVSPTMKYTSDGYKLPQRTVLPSQGSSAMTVSSSPSKSQPKEDKINNRAKASSNRVKQRSRSNTREPIKRPPLQSAISDPSLITPASSSSSMILTQLLTNNTDGLYHPPRQNQNGNNNNNKEEPAAQLCILPHASTTNSGGALIITTPVNTDPLLTPGSPLVVDASPTSPGSPNREPPVQREQRRAGHIHAEQKRRYNIKNGFDMIHSLIPHLNQNPNAKLSKAAMLQKGAEYIMQLRTERDQLKEEMDSLRQQIESLNTSISNCQSLLPATGAPVSRRRDSKMQEMFDEYVRTRTIENWRFWIFSLLFKPLLASFNNFVSTSSLDDLYRSTLHWIEQHCTLSDLRPVVLNSLRYLCTKTDVLCDPSQLPEEARKQVTLSCGGSKN